MLAQYVNKFPIPNPSKDQLTQVASLVTTEMKNPSMVLEQKIDLIDLIVYDLFHLDKQERKFIEHIDFQ